MDDPEGYKCQDSEVYISKFLRLCLPSWAVVAHAFNHSTQEAEAGRSL